jgi:hypothetical protein
MLRHVEPEDYEQVSLIFLLGDNDNLVEYLKNGQLENPSMGNYSLEDFSSFVGDMDSVSHGHELPPYMQDLIRDHFDEAKTTDPLEYPKILAEGYYTYVMEKATPFLKSYIEFDYNLKNLITAYKVGKHGVFDKDKIFGSNSLAQHLQSPTGKNLVSDGDFDFFDEIYRIALDQSFAEAERKTDYLRWRVIEDMMFFEYFTINKIIGYILKLQIISRWEHLTRDAGEKRLRSIISGIMEKASNDSNLVKQN